MAAFKDKCRQCGKEFTNYDAHIAYRRFCSVACEVAWAIETEKLAGATRPEEGEK